MLRARRRGRDRRVRHAGGRARGRQRRERPSDAHAHAQQQQRRGARARAARPFARARRLTAPRAAPPSPCAQGLAIGADAGWAESVHAVPYLLRRLSASLCVEDVLPVLIGDRHSEPTFRALREAFGVDAAQQPLPPVPAPGRAATTQHGGGVGAISIGVGLDTDAPTAAMYRLADAAELDAFLRALAHALPDVPVGGWVRATYAHV